MKRYFANAKGQWSLWRTLRNLIAILLVLGVALAGKFAGDLRETLSSIEEASPIPSLRPREVAIDKGEPLNVLLVGTDADAQARSESQGYIGRSDTLMLVNVNPALEHLRILSIPRDSLVQLPGYPGPEKINHAFAYGGIEMTVQAVQDFLQVPVDYYAVINMSGLEEVIDALGGIEVTSPISFEYRGTGFKAGETREVNGVKAMNFARMRYDDPQGEVGRQNRQRIVIKGIVDKALSPQGWASIPKVLDVVADNVVTNADLQDVMARHRKYLPALKSIGSVKLENLQEVYLDDIFYFYVPVSSRVKVANIFRNWSQMQPVTVRNFYDPLEDSGESLHNLALIINQYPSGLNQQEESRIHHQQQAIVEARQQQSRRPPHPDRLPDSVEGPLPDPQDSGMPIRESALPPSQEGELEGEAVSPAQPIPSGPGDFQVEEEGPGLPGEALEQAADPAPALERPAEPANPAGDRVPDDLFEGD